MTNQTLTPPNTTTEQPRVTPPPRLNMQAHSGKAYQAMLSFAASVEELGLEKSLLHLINVRVSQINGCAFCIDMHTIDAVAQGETHQRLHALNAWRETPFFTARERAALALSEQVTLLTGEAMDEVVEEAAAEFSEAEVVAITWASALINTMNRIAITSRVTPGQYRVGEAS